MKKSVEYGMISKLNVYYMSSRRHQKGRIGVSQYE